MKRVRYPRGLKAVKLILSYEDIGSISVNFQHGFILFQLF
jgi:hypothetical protein